MDLAERIARRRTRKTKDRLVGDWDALNPAIHPPEPIGREALFEALLDAIDPIFSDELPGNVYVWGPPGAGKSAIVTALMSTLRTELSSQRPIVTATRGDRTRSDVRFVYLDARQASSRFKIYRGILDAIRPESVPRRGVGTDDLREQLEAEMATCEGALVAVDHLGEPDTVDLEDVRQFFTSFAGVSWIGVGRTPPEELTTRIPRSKVHVPQYTYELVDILTVRGTRGLSRSLDHDDATRLAEWADGNAHDALAALFVAAAYTQEDGRGHIRSEDVDAGIDAVPEDGIPIGRVLALSDNERLVLRRLLALSLEGDYSIDEAASEIASNSDLTSGTVKRLLYELAQIDILRRVEVSVGTQMVGRQPSKVTPNFSAALFERLHNS